VSDPRPDRHVRVRVPGSTANLGPGFDVLAAALALHLEVEVRETGTFEVLTDLDVPLDRSNLVVRAFELLAPSDRLQFRIASAIPLSGGLGSSAAAIVAGLLAADRLRGSGPERSGPEGSGLRGPGLERSGADLFALAVELEGHPDNVGAALHGGFVICDGRRVARLDPPDGLDAVLVVPHESVRTQEARAALPDTVALADAVFNVGRAARLVRGLSTGDLDLVSEGLDDRLHQPYRAHLYPRSSELVVRARSLGALGATISGAGPTVLVWARREQTDGLMRELDRLAGGWAAVMRASFESRGAEVLAP